MAHYMGHQLSSAEPVPSPHLHQTPGGSQDRLHLLSPPGLSTCSFKIDQLLIVPIGLSARIITYKKHFQILSTHSCSQSIFPWQLCFVIIIIQLHNRLFLYPALTLAQQVCEGINLQLCPQDQIHGRRLHYLNKFFSLMVQPIDFQSLIILQCYLRDFEIFFFAFDTQHYLTEIFKRAHLVHSFAKIYFLGETVKSLKLCTVEQYLSQYKHFPFRIRIKKI